jgi:hypothetical protein
MERPGKESEIRTWGGIKDARTYDARMRVTNFNGYFAVNYQY